MAWCVGQALRARQGVKKRKPEKKNVVSVRKRIRRLVFFVFFLFWLFSRSKRVVGCSRADEAAREGAPIGREQGVERDAAQRGKGDGPLAPPCRRPSLSHGDDKEDDA